MVDGIDELIDKACKLAQKQENDHPELRYGQCIWNAMIDVFGPLVEPYRGTQLDPFYRDDRVEPFLEDFKHRFSA